MRQEGFATAFERITQELAAIRQRSALHSLFSWNWESKLNAQLRDLEEDLEKTENRWSWVEITACAIALFFAMCSCEPRKDDPDRSDPFEPPAQILPIRPVHAETLRDGSMLIVLRAQDL